MFSKCVCRVLVKKVSIQVSEQSPFSSIWSSQTFCLLVEPKWTPYGQISMFQLTEPKTDSERQLQTSSCVVAFNFFPFYFSKHLHMRSNYFKGNARDLRYDGALGPQVGLCVCTRKACVECSLRKFLYKFLNELLKKSSPKVPYERIL